MHIVATAPSQSAAAIAAPERYARLHRQARNAIVGRETHGEPARVNKKRRQQVILELVAAQPVASQEELRQLLDDRGFAVTQSTLSRDLRELRLARIPSPQGARYASPDSVSDDHR